MIFVLSWISLHCNYCEVSFLTSYPGSMFWEMFLVKFLVVLLQLHLRSAICRRRRRLMAFRRQQIIQTVVMMQLLVNSRTVHHPRRQWVRNRSGHWWQHVVPSFTPREWWENFRMSKSTFEYLCDQLRPFIHRQHTRLRSPLSVQRRVAITLWTLSTPAEYRTIGCLFWVARSAVCVIVHSTCEAIVEHLISKFIACPWGNALEETITGFERKWNTPQCTGAIDGSHIPVCTPGDSRTDYYNRKGWYSMLIQAVVNHNYLALHQC